MDFETAAREVQTLKTCSDDDKLYLYSHYKQVRVGDCNTRKLTVFHPSNSIPHSQ